jgi:hypothetical protein
LKDTRQILLVALSTLGLAALVAAPGTGADVPAPGDRWPAWRGADGQGIADGARIPLEWSATKNVLWKTALPGRGLSSPVVWGDRLFLTTALEGEVVTGDRIYIRGHKHLFAIGDASAS